MKKLVSIAVLSIASTLAYAKDPDSCKTVRFAEVGWTDIAITTAMARSILESLGYDTKSTLLSVPVLFQALANGKNMDVYLGTWLPTMENDVKAYRDSGAIELTHINLRNGKYTLAVNKQLYDAGLKDFSDLPKFKDQLDGKIYSVEPGNDGNRLLQGMIDKNDFELKDAGFTLVESSEAAMLSQVGRATRRNEPIVFLAWEPHPMNTKFDIKYLTGGDAYFGPNFGEATVYTTTRKNFSEECPNVGKFLANLTFSLDMENRLMNRVLNDRIKPDIAAKNWLDSNPQILKGWLEGVTSFDGSPAPAP